MQRNFMPTHTPASPDMPMQRDEAIAYLAGRVLLGLNDSRRHVHDNGSIQSIVPLLAGAFIRQFPKQKNWSVQFEDTQTPSGITMFQHQPQPKMNHCFAMEDNIRI